ncbi:MAG: GNAT family N-acetyltransferase [Pirellulales bacterium]|nr:GNAT family N-acetyltransferase [Pirellulales bacterium]
MHDTANSVLVQEVSVAPPGASARFEGLMFTGSGREVVERIGRETSQNGAAVLDAIVRQLLVKKGADWTNVILSEYLELYDDSAGTFALVWDRSARRLAAHGSAFSSKAHPAAALVAHIRTDESCQGLGLGTLVTEAVTRAAFRQGAQVVVLGTDDKRHRLREGEKAAFGLYAKLGYAILAERVLSDTVEWLMIVDPPIFERCQREKQSAGMRFPPTASPDVRAMQHDLVEEVRGRFSQELTGGRTSPVGLGDLANLFLLLNLCPAEDFQAKLTAWGVHLGPELERCYTVNVRAAMADCDRLEEASLALRDGQGLILAVCAARRALPFTRNTMEIDFYCLPRFFAANQAAVAALVEAALTRIGQSAVRPRPCRVVFSGVDAEKVRLFKDLGFAPTGNTFPYFSGEGKPAFQAQEWEKNLS